MNNARLLELRARAATFASPELIAELEKSGLLWWAVASRQVDPNKRPAIVGDSNVECGWYKHKQGAYGATVPVAIWLENGDLTAAAGFKPTPWPMPEVRNAWRWLCKNPIPYEEYEAAIKAGKFPSITAAPAPTAPDAPSSDGVSVVPIGIGHNRPPPEEIIGIENFKAAIEEQVAEDDTWLKGFEKTGLDDTSVKEAGPRWERLCALFRHAEKAREEETAPLYKRWQEALTKWAFTKKADNLAKRMRKMMTDYANKERVRREAAVTAQVAKGVPVSEIKKPEPVRIEGATRAVPLPRAAPIKRIVVITDYSKLLEFLKERPAVKAAVLAEAQAIFDATGSEDLPGTKIERSAA